MIHYIPKRLIRDRYVRLRKTACGENIDHVEASTVRLDNATCVPCLRRYEKPTPVDPKSIILTDEEMDALFN